MKVVGGGPKGKAQVQSQVWLGRSSADVQSAAAQRVSSYGGTQSWGGGGAPTMNPRARSPMQGSSDAAQLG